MVQLKHIQLHPFGVLCQQKQTNRPDRVHVQCHVLMDAADDLKYMSGLMAIRWIICEKEKKKGEEIIDFYIIDSKLKPGEGVSCFFFKFASWVKCEKKGVYLPPLLLPLFRPPPALKIHSFNEWIKCHANWRTSRPPAHAPWLLGKVVTRVQGPCCRPGRYSGTFPGPPGLGSASSQRGSAFRPWRGATGPSFHNKITHFWQLHFF